MTDELEKSIQAGIDAAEALLGEAKGDFDGFPRECVRIINDTFRDLHHLSEDIPELTPATEAAHKHYHLMRNRLNLIFGYMHMVTEDETITLSERQGHLVQQIHHHAFRLNDIIDALDVWR